MRLEKVQPGLTFLHYCIYGAACAISNPGTGYNIYGQTILGSITDPGTAKLCTVQTEVNDESDIYTVALNTFSQTYVI